MRAGGMRGAPSLAGFTLVEVLIALSLLALIMLGLVSALAGFGTTASKLEAHAGRDGEAWQVAAFLRAALASGVGQLRETQPNGAPAVYFRGGARELAWLGSMPARYGSGGMHHFRLAVEGEPPRLTPRYLPYTGNAPLADEAASSHALVDRLEDFHVAYQRRPARPDEAPLWSDDWRDADHLPARLRIDIAADGRRWPPLLVAIDAVDHAAAHAAAAGGD